jgi:hypothetical protein
MNILIMFLRDHPAAVHELAGRGTDAVPLKAVVDVISRLGDFPVALDRDLLDRLTAEPLGEALINGYLPVRLHRRPVPRRCLRQGQVGTPTPTLADSRADEHQLLR